MSDTIPDIYAPPHPTLVDKKLSAPHPPQASSPIPHKRSKRIGALLAVALSCTVTTGIPIAVGYVGGQKLHRYYLPPERKPIQTSPPSSPLNAADLIRLSAVADAVDPCVKENSAASSSSPNSMDEPVAITDPKGLVQCLNQVRVGFFSFGQPIIVKESGEAELVKTPIPYTPSAVDAHILAVTTMEGAYFSNHGIYYGNPKTLGEKTYYESVADLDAQIRKEERDPHWYSIVASPKGLLTTLTGREMVEDITSCIRDARSVGLIGEAEIKLPKRLRRCLTQLEQQKGVPVPQVLQTFTTPQKIYFADSWTDVGMGNSVDPWFVPSSTPSAPSVSYSIPSPPTPLPQKSR